MKRFSVFKKFVGGLGVCGLMTAGVGGLGVSAEDAKNKGSISKTAYYLRVDLESGKTLFDSKSDAVNFTKGDCKEMTAEEIGLESKSYTNMGYLGLCAAITFIAGIGAAIGSVITSALSSNK